ncbi:MAG: bifunctional isocitrate dehydrogenase kinase/phosphatase [Myxococcaceae bacterium]|nr:bifunctional isocitrate dehydrogenase kinase/phosphatase [Myxococcaceae bacterium]
MSAPFAEQVARAIVQGFDRHYSNFWSLSALAKEHFEAADWKAMRESVQERIFSYDRRVNEAVTVITRDFPEAKSEAHWPAIKSAYVGLLLDHQQPECAETFFNSVVCRMLSRQYYTNQYLFWRAAVSTEHIESERPCYRVYYPAQLGQQGTVHAIIADQQLRSEWEDLHRDLSEVQRRLKDLVPRKGELRPNFQVHVLSSLFFRGKAAYLIGRVRNGPEETAFAVAVLKNEKNQLYIDAFLTGHDELAHLFSLARAYFMVEMEVPSAYVAFLKSIFPLKPAAELYTALGLQKQGKTLFYRDFQNHLRHSSDLLVTAEGVPGMVMVVFTLPSFPYVFKVIRDKFEPPKDSDRDQVMAQYLRVKLHDRVGRMADTLEYSHVAFPLARVSPELVAELEKKAPSMLAREGDALVIRHLYIERRMTPLDLWLKGASEEKLRHGVREYGNAIRELAGANLFPGDMLLKNFGMTRSGRVVFYDYDEIALVTDCQFRRMPTPSDDDSGNEPSFFVDRHDIFPEELPRFLFASDRARALFLEEHGDLATPEFWRTKQAQLREGVEDDVFPYPAERRFRLRRAPVSE